MLWRFHPGFALSRGAIDGPAGPSWTATFSQVFTADQGGWGSTNQRQVLNSSLLSTSGTLVRVTLQASSSAGFSVDSAYIGHQAGSGDPYDFDGGQAQLKVGGSASFSASTGASVVSDAITFALDHTKNLVLAIHYTGTSAIRGTGLSGASNYFKSGADETSVSNVSSMSLDGANVVRAVTKIEVQ
ncbi:hypothetical protein ABIE89_007529 [Bradyrhizobium niftali]|uniref:hypothetical protein n=1 Tax=Bradyrhizobium niftali TaxID=2560055 RepID=UPI0038328E6A